MLPFNLPLASSHIVVEPSKEPTACSLAPVLRKLKGPGSLWTVDERTRRYELAQAKLTRATSYHEWLNAAVELDDLDGNEEWKKELESEDYDYQLIEAWLRQLEDARMSSDVGRMLFLIRTTLSRNLGDMGNILLYQHSRTGTKRHIEEYINSCLATINSLLYAPRTSDSPTNRDILEALIHTRQSFGRTALLLSGGATFGMNHIGVVKALLEVDLLPRIISGASAGSIVASVLCTRTEDELPNLLSEFAYGDLNVFEDGNNPDNVFTRIARFLKIGAWIDIKHLVRVMRNLLGDITFQEAYNRTRRILNIGVSSASIYDLPRILNYITSPNVLIWSAVAASCSVPFLFSSTSLLAKDPKTGNPVPWNASPQRWIDGSVDNDLPMARLSEMFNVNHFIVSQVNPHVIPFLSKQEYSSNSGRTSESSWTQTAANLAISEATHRISVLAEIGIFRTSLTKAKSVLSQKYSGDITIFPKISVKDFGHMLKNPTTDFMLRASLCGEQATWPKLSRIRNHCAIELELDKAINTLRTKVVFSPSQADLRLMIPRRAAGHRRRVKSSEGMILRGRRLHYSRSRPELPRADLESEQNKKRIKQTTGSGPSLPNLLRVCDRPPSSASTDSDTASSEESGRDASEESEIEYSKNSVNKRIIERPRKIAIPSPKILSGPFNLLMTPTPLETPYSSKAVSPERRRDDAGYMDIPSKSTRRRKSLGSFDFETLGWGANAAAQS